MKKGNTVLIFGIIIVALIVFCANLLMKGAANEELNKNLTSEVEVWRNESGQQVARIEFLEYESTKSIKAYNGKSEEVLKLKELVEKYDKQLRKGGSATVVKGETVVETVTNTVTVEGDSIYPTYKADIDLQSWIMANVIANKDSVSLKLKVRHEYNVVFGVERTGFLGLGKGKPFTEITNLNPYSETTTISTYSVKRTDRPKKFGIGIMVGYGANQTSFGPMIGGGLTYNIIRF